MFVIFPEYIFMDNVPYSAKAWWAECLGNLLFFLWRKKAWEMNRSAKGLLMVTTNLDGFSLANHRRFTKSATLSAVPAKLSCYTVPSWQALWTCLLFVTVSSLSIILHPFLTNYMFLTSLFAATKILVE